MVGVITKENVNLLLIEISNKNNNVYWYKDNNLEKGIEALKEKNCNIIVTGQDYSKINESNIKFINLKPTYNNDDYVLDDKELVDAVIAANEAKVIEILSNIDIPKDKNIIITNPTLLFIKHIIEEKLKIKVKTINDLILDEIPKSEETGEIFLIN
jgi:hypothetical protein